MLWLASPNSTLTRVSQTSATFELPGYLSCTFLFSFNEYKKRHRLLNIFCRIQYNFHSLYSA